MSRHVRLRTLEGALMGAAAYAVASGDRRWYRAVAARLRRVRTALRFTR